MMETLITAIQSLCGAGLVLGVALSLYQGARPREESKRLRLRHRQRFRNRPPPLGPRPVSTDLLRSTFSAHSRTCGLRRFFSRP